jgi:hypothetical protein
MEAIRRLTSLAVVASGLGCVHVETMRVDAVPRRQSVCPAGVAIYTAEGGVGRPYRALAWLSASAGSVWTSEEEMVLSLRDRAAELGANGLILGPFREPSVGVKVAAELLGRGADRKGMAAAIYIAEDSARTGEACRGVRRP